METPLWAQDLENLGGLWKESEGMLAYTVYMPLSLFLTSSNCWK